jgi:hypothetical protein
MSPLSATNATARSVVEAQPVEVNGVWRIRVRFADGEIITYERPVEREIDEYAAAGDKRSSAALSEAASMAAKLNGLR